MAGSMKILLKPRSGLANRLRAIDAAWNLSRDTGHPLRVYWFDTEDCHVRWSDILEFPSQFEVVEVDAANQAESDAIFSGGNHDYYRWEKEKDFIDDCRRGNESDLALESFSRFYGTQPDYCWLAPKKDLLAEIDRIHAEIGKKLVGIHIRRTDMYMASFLSDTGMFVKRIEEELQRHPDERFFLATDDPSEKKFLTEKYPGVVRTREKVAARHDDGGVRDAFIDLLMLSSCRKIYGSVYSSFSAEAAAIGRIKLFRVVNPDRVPMTVVVRKGADAEELRRCLDSLCNQWFKRYEVICVDDRSDAGYSSVIDSYPGKLMGISRAATVQEAVSKARGKYVSFLYTFEVADFSFVKTLFNTAERCNARQILFSPGRFTGKRQDALCRKLNGYTRERLPWKELHGATIPSLVARLLFGGARKGVLCPIGFLHLTLDLKDRSGGDTVSDFVSGKGRTFLFCYEFTRKNVTADNQAALDAAIRGRGHCRCFAGKALILRKLAPVLRVVFKKVKGE